MTKWTPGEWVVEEPMDHELVIVEAGKKTYEWRFIAGCPWPDGKGDIPRNQVIANARLIAAAPTMAEYIKKHADDGCKEAAEIWRLINA